MPLAIFPILSSDAAVAAEVPGYQTTVFAVILVPVGLVAFALALRRARVEGTLVQY